VFVDFAHASRLSEERVRVLCWPEQRLFALVSVDRAADQFALDMVEGALAGVTRVACGIDEIAEVRDGLDAELADRDARCDLVLALLERDGVAFLGSGTSMAHAMGAVRTFLDGTSPALGERAPPHYFRASVSPGVVFLLATDGIAHRVRTLRPRGDVAAIARGFVDGAHAPGAVIVVRVTAMPGFT
jgi:hypothetical protein